MRRSLLLPLVVCFPALAWAQAPFGPEFQVNAYTQRDQFSPRVAADEMGRFVVVWHRVNEYYNGEGVFGQRLDAAGRPLGGEFRVSAAPTSDQGAPSLGVAIDGSFVVTWATDADGDGSGIAARRFNASAAPLGAEFRVNTTVASSQYEPDLGLDASGFVVVWTSYDQDGSEAGVFGQRFDTAGTRRGAEFRVNAYTTSSQRSPSVALVPGGAFLVVWTSDGQSGDGSEIFARRFDAQGVPQAAEFHVNTYTSNFQLAPQVSLDGLGNFVVVWADVARAVIAGRRFGPTGSPVGGEFTIPAAGAAGAPSRPAVAADPPGFVVAWEDYGSVDDFGEVYARRYDGAGAAGPVFRLDQYSGGTQSEPAVATLPGRGLVATWWAWDQVGRPDGIFARRLGDLGPSALAADPAGSSTSNGNGVMEPGETLTVAPTWRNSTAAARPATGMLSQFTGPGAASLYTITDAAAGYGTLPATGTGGCTAAGNCYALALAVPGARPAAHWDATVREDVTATALQPPEVWRLHVGDSFTDVPRSSPFYRFVETLFHRGVAGGCAAGLYCPQTSATREQMAVFVLGGREPSWFGPLPCTPGQEQFADVPASSPFCSWIEELARRGVTSGCDGANYCPTAPVSREQMSVFVLRTLDPLLDPPACGTPVFSDVPASSPFCRWIEELARRGIVGGCAPGLYCPTASVSRQEMAVFITGTFGLTLYGP